MNKIPAAARNRVRKQVGGFGRDLRPAPLDERRAVAGRRARWSWKQA